jgi:hypothetical protein
VGTGADHFNPAHNAMIFEGGSDPERPLGAEDRRAYQQQLKHFLADAYPEKPRRKADKTWAKLQAKATTTVDDQGRPVLEVRMGESLVQIGVAADNVLSGSAPLEFERELLEARLQAELRGPAQQLSEEQVSRDWDLLQKTVAESYSLASRLTPRSENVAGNQP